MADDEKDEQSTFPTDETETNKENDRRDERSCRVAYVFNEELIKLSDELPKIKGRASIVHSLIRSYGLLSKMRLISPHKAKLTDILLFHSSEYIDCLQKLSDEDDDEKWMEEAETFGLTYDCPAYPGIFDTASYITGASVKAAQALSHNYADVAINWTGGWHHAKRDEAAGFCYINDIVVAILILRQKFDKVLYVDLDLHHGDGVEDAFCATSKVMTVSFHKHAPGFFPGTGSSDDCGMGKGQYYTVNVPLQDGMNDENFVSLVKRVLGTVYKSFKPQAVVCQCGADGLDGDPMASFNLSTDALVDSVQFITNWKLPLLLLGGGGYNMANTARCWTAITASVLKEKLPSDIPEHRFFPLYGPDYELTTSQGNRIDRNKDSHLQNVIAAVDNRLLHGSKS
uniref:Histone deacetylase n=1 Tax=Platynereis dumerilii TaxID=6359 RepID=A0A8E7IVS2_PLADU|nr:HDAC8 [Platynereis dumerilii]